MKLIEVEHYGTSRAENLYFAWCVSSEDGLGTPKGKNRLFNDFQKSIDLKIEEKLL